MKKQKHDGGFVAMSVGAGLLIVLVMASMAARYMGDYLKSREWQVVAMQTNRFTQAASSYVGRYYPTVLASATTTKPVVVTSQMLKNTGLLPASFSETNSYGQQYQAMIVRNQQNQELLQGMVVSRGGHAMPFTALNQISKDITAGFGGYVEDGQTAVGAMRSWRIALSSYGTSTGRGHLAVMLSTDDLSGAREDGDRLYRFQVNGRPDLNKMHTSIDMGGNNLNAVGTVVANSATVNTVSGQSGSFSVSLVSNGPITAGGDIPCMWCAGKAIRSVILLVWHSTVMPAPHSGCRSPVLMRSIKPEPGGHNEKVCLVAECALVFLYLCGGG